MDYLNEKRISIQKKKVQPFIKWVGGKRNILPELLKRLPKNFNRYYEPFIGGGVLFFSIAAENSFISDINQELILSYLIIKTNPRELMSILNFHIKNHSKEYYYRIRRLYNLTDDINLVARFIYLNKTCFNGLYRKNKKGEFNVPIGSYKKVSVYNEENIMACSKILQDTKIKTSCFSKLKEPNENDFVYFDPPYHKTFTGYTANSFTEDNQIELRNLCRELDKKKVFFMVSNSNTDFIQKLYSNFNIEELIAPRYINCKGNDRKNGREVIITNYE